MATKKKPIPEFYGEPPKTLDGHPFYGLQLDEEQQKFANAIWSPDIDIVFCNARAGTGKTTIATGVANLLIQYGMFSNLVYIMSPYGERKQGWLPGTITEKSSVLMMLLEADGKVVSRDTLLTRVWGEFYDESRTLDVHIRKLRIKLETVGDLIQTVKNIGYKLGGSENG